MIKQKSKEDKNMTEELRDFIDLRIMEKIKKITIDPIILVIYFLTLNYCTEEPIIYREHVGDVQTLLLELLMK